MSAQIIGDTLRVLIGPDRDSFVTREVAEAQVSFEGFVGDRHAGFTMVINERASWFPKGTTIRNTRQVSIVSAEELAQVAATLDLPTVLASWLGANLELAGVPRLTQLPPGTRLLFPEDAGLVVEGENEPCTGPGKVIEDHHPERVGIKSRFVKAAYQRRGLVAWVERPGVIRPGDVVKVMLPPPVTYSLPPAADTAAPGSEIQSPPAERRPEKV